MNRAEQDIEARRLFALHKQQIGVVQVMLRTLQRVCELEGITKTEDKHFVCGFLSGALEPLTDEQAALVEDPPPPEALAAGRAAFAEGREASAAMYSGAFAWGKARREQGRGEPSSLN